jgi:xanthine dehydrogenase YagR molybdenum-binding subunit
VTSTIAKGRIARIDASEALRVEGVLAISPMRTGHRGPLDQPLQGRCGPRQGTPLRPLYDDKIPFSNDRPGLAENEIARFAARWCAWSKPEPFATDLFAERDKAVKVEKPEKPRGKADKAFALHRCGTKRNISFRSTSQSDGVVRLDRGLGGRRQAHRLRQDPGRAECAAYLCGIFNMEPDDVRVLSPYGQRLRLNLRPQYRIVLAVLGAKARQRPCVSTLTASRCTGSPTGRRPSNGWRSAPSRTEHWTRSRTRRSP